MFILTRYRIWLAIFSFSFIFLTVWPTTASVPIPQFVEQQLLTPVATQPGGGFGVDVVLSQDGKTAAVGVPFQEVDGRSNQGSVQIYTRSSLANIFTLAQLLTPSSGVSNTFGPALAMSEDAKTLWVGAPGIIRPYSQSNIAGSVYIFSRTDITAPFLQTQILTASNGTINNFFGFPIALSQDGNTALVIAQGQPNQPGLSGAVYAFSRPNAGGQYIETQIITPTLGSSNFGDIDLSADGNTAIIGSWYRNGGEGGAYIFTRTNLNSVFSQTQLLLASNRQSHDEFGWEVALSPDASAVLVTAPGTVNGSNRYGSVYVFTQTLVGIYSETSQITAPDAGELGHAPKFSTDNKSFVVGSISSNRGDAIPTVPKVYFFSWISSAMAYSLTQTITSPSANLASDFGEYLDWSESTNTLLVGAHRDSINQVYSGAAYVYSPAPPSSIELTRNMASIIYGQPAIFTATVTGTPYNNAPVSGSVAFYLNGQQIYTTAILSGTSSAVFSSTNLPVGQLALSAVYNLGGNLATNTSSPISVEVRSPFTVIETSDDGTGITPGSFSYAIAKVPAFTSPVTITFALPGTNILTFSNPFSASIPARTSIEGSSCVNPIVIVGNVGQGLYLQGQNYLHNLQIRGFTNQQIIAASPNNRLECVQAAR